MRTIPSLITVPRYGFKEHILVSQWFQKTFLVPFIHMTLAWLCVKLQMNLEIRSFSDESGEIILEAFSKKTSRGHHHRHHPASPNKRHRLTPRPQNIQRPCLDFEKMQQVLWIELVKMAFPGLFLFIFVFSTNSLLWIIIQWNVPVTGSELGFSGIRSTALPTVP